ncbi:MAG: ribonuclease P protein component [Gemmatimonas sp.]
MAPDSPSESRDFPRAQRLTRGSELAVVRQQGKRVRTATMDVRAIASLRASARVGVVVPRYKHSAVARNRLKRRLRELVRLEWLPVLPVMDVVVKAIPPAYDRDFDALRAEMRQAAERLMRLSLPARVDTLATPTP